MKSDIQNSPVAQKEKRKVAFWSVLAAVFITIFKLIVGVTTGSLGILSEALHSGLDLVAAVITYFAVKISDKPADEDHNFGHGKVENLSALIETFLLFITCIWIVFEAVERLITKHSNIEVTVWSYVVVVTSIIVDFNRSRSLRKAAKKYKSQALEADALHFSSDIWSSAVVGIGLICTNFGFFYADSIAALMVAIIVIYVSYRLGRQAVDVLLDRSPEKVNEKIKIAVSKVPGVISFHDIRVRTSGARTFVELNIHLHPGLSISEAHKISHEVEENICNVVDNCVVHVHEEPDN